MDKFTAFSSRIFKLCFSNAASTASDDKCSAWSEKYTYSCYIQVPFPSLCVRRKREVSLSANSLLLVVSSSVTFSNAGSHCIKCGLESCL